MLLYITIIYDIHINRSRHAIVIDTVVDTLSQSFMHLFIAGRCEPMFRYSLDYLLLHKP